MARFRAAAIFASSSPSRKMRTALRTCFAIVAAAMLTLDETPMLRLNVNYRRGAMMDPDGHKGRAMMG